VREEGEERERKGQGRERKRAKLIDFLNEVKLTTLVAKRKESINKYASTSHWSVSTILTLNKYNKTK
jgi:hypothetical protein